MSFSFIDIEEEKSRVIAWLFLAVILAYFLTAYLILIIAENSFYFQLFSGREKFGLFLPPLKHVGVALGIAFIAAYLHWFYSTSNLIKKLSLIAGAFPIDTKDTYHQYFKNIVDEVCVATGGRVIEPQIIPSSNMNAFALQDFSGRAVIGITEGLLSRLNRSQIEAVVAHEAGHIASGDCLSATVLCSLGEIYEEGLSRVKSGLQQTRGRISFLLLILIVLTLMRFLSRFLRCFLSRQRELRADATAVRLTRDPLSLAEALKLIARSWRGEGLQGENLESIFIVNPRFDAMDEEEGILSDLFSTHPPVKKRISTLLSMAHLDEKTLEENLKNFRRVSPVAKPLFVSDNIVTTKRWQIFEAGAWKGPFSLEELKGAVKLLPSHWVRLEGTEQVMPAYDDPDLRMLFAKSPKAQDDFSCPNCKVSLQEYHYEGAPVFKCSYCAGIFIEDYKVSRILVRQDYVASEEILRLARTIADSKDKIMHKKIDPKSVWIIDCPKCKRKMRRQFFVYSYPVEIDRCINCAGVWFDKDELEVLQYIYEHKQDFLYDHTF